MDRLCARRFGILFQNLVSLLLFAFIQIAQAAGVISFSPQGEVTQPNQVRATFSSPMHKLSAEVTPAPFFWSCQEDGRVILPPLENNRWIDDKTWVLDISDTLAANTACRFTTKTGLRDLAGKSIPRKIYSFDTGKPKIVESWPKEYEHITEDQAFVLKLNGSFSKSISLSCSSSRLPERIPVQPLAQSERDVLIKHLELEKEQANRLLTVRCAQRLAADSKLTLVYEYDKKSAPQRWAFNVQPAFTAKLLCQRSHAKDDCNPLSPVELVFSSSVSSALAAKIRLTGHNFSQVPDKLNEQLVERLVFSPLFPKNTQLTVEFPPHFIDNAQRPLSGTQPLTIKTAEYPPLAKFAAAPFGIIEAGKDAAVPLTLRGVEAKLPIKTTTVTGRAVQMTDDLQIMHWLEQVIHYHENSWPVDSKHPNKKWIESRRLSLLDKEPHAQTLTLPQLPKPISQAPTNTVQSVNTLAQQTWPKDVNEVIGIPVNKPGFYVFEIKSQILGQALLGEPAPMYVRTAALVTNLAVHFKHSAENAMVWVTSLDKAQPVANANVRVYNCRRQMLWQGVTDKQGQARIDAALAEMSCDDAQLNGFLITAHVKNEQGVEDVSFARSTWNRGIEPWRFPYPTDTSYRSKLIGHTVMDRTLVRVGETVSMKHFMRAQTAQRLALLKPEQLPQRVNIVHLGSGQEYRQPLTWRDARYAESNFVIPKQAKLGEYLIYLERSGTRNSEDAARTAALELDGYELESGRFRVESFKVPMMNGVLTMPKKILVGETTLPLDMTLTWNNGGAVKHWPVTLSAMLSTHYGRVPNYDEFYFDPPEQEDQNQINHLDGKIVLDKLSLKLDEHGHAKASIANLPKIDRPYDVATEMSYADSNGQIQTLSRSFTLWPAAVRLGIQVDSWASVKQGPSVKVIALDLSNKPVSRQAIQIHLRKINYLSTRKRLVGGFYAYEHHRTREDKGIVCRGVTNATGYFFCEMPSMQEGGNFELIAHTADAKGNTTSSAQQIWISGQDEHWFDAGNHDRIDVIPEKNEYLAGETARLQVRMPFRQATAWVAIERQGILETRVLSLNGKNPVIEIKTEPDWAPNVYVSVLAIRGRIHEVSWYSFFSWGWKDPKTWWQAFRRQGKDEPPPTALVDLARPAFKFGVTQLRVGEAANRLRVEVTPERKQYGTRQTATVTIKVFQPNGKPAAAGTEVAFAAVDEALLALQPNHSWDLLEAMYKRHSYGVETATAQSEVVGKRHYGRKAMLPGGGGGQAPTRELLDTLLTWQPHVVLDKQGMATVKVPINDALTRIRLVAIADQGATWFGNGSNTFDVTQDVQIISGVPLFARQGDRLNIVITVRNSKATNTAPLKVRVRAQAVGLSALPEHTLSLPAGESRQVSWSVNVPNDVQQLRWTFDVSEMAAQNKEGKELDKLRITQAIEPAIAVSVQQALVKRLDQSISIPIAVPTNALKDSQQRIQGGVRVLLQAKLADNLPGVTQWLMRYPYSCLEQRTSVALGLQDKKRWQELIEELPIYLDETGLAAYFPLSEGARQQGSDVLTSYLLSSAYEAGFVMPENLRQQMITGLSRFIEGRTKRLLPIGNQDIQARQLAAMAALVRYRMLEVKMLSVLGNVDKQMRNWRTDMLLDWLFVVQHLKNMPKRAFYIQEVNRLLRNQLIYQSSLIKFNQQASGTAWWLMGNGDVNQAKLLMTVFNLPEWQADLPRLLNGLLTQQRQGHWQTTAANLWASLAVKRFAEKFESTPVTGKVTMTLRQQQVTTTWQNNFATPAEHLLAWPKQNANLQIEQQGHGQPWATIQTLAAINLQAPHYAGYSVHKVLTPVSQKVAGQYQPGDIVKVTLTINAQTDMTWVVVDDPVPAGVSVLGSGLGRDSAIATHGTFESDAITPDYIERRASAYLAYLSYVPRGKFILEYTMRVNSPGSFNLPPTRVEAMYAPDIFGMLPNPIFKVDESR